jgi:hypothetical protein
MYATEISSDSMIYVYSMIHKDIEQLLGGGAIHRHTDSMEIALAYLRKVG